MKEMLTQIGVYRIENRLCPGIAVLFVAVLLFGQSYIGIIDNISATVLVIASFSISYIIGFVLEAIGALLGSLYYKYKLWNKKDYGGFAKRVKDGDTKIQSLSHNVTTASTYSAVLAIIAVFVSIRWLCIHPIYVVVIDIGILLLLRILFLSGKRNSQRIAEVLTFEVTIDVGPNWD